MGVIIVEDAETDKKQGNSWPNTSVNKHRAKEKLVKTNFWLRNEDVVHPKNVTYVKT